MQQKVRFYSSLRFGSSKTKIQQKTKVMCSFCIFCIFFSSYNRRKGHLECQELFIRLAHVLPINTLSSFLNAVGTLWINNLFFHSILAAQHSG